MCDMLQSVREELMNLEANGDENKESSDEATFENLPVEVLK